MGERLRLRATAFVDAFLLVVMLGSVGTLGCPCFCAATIGRKRPTLSYRQQAVGCIVADRLFAGTAVVDRVVFSRSRIARRARFETRNESDTAEKNL
jgi:hypothetical protein